MNHGYRVFAGSPWLEGARALGTPARAPPADWRREGRAAARAPATICCWAACGGVGTPIVRGRPLPACGACARRVLRRTCRRRTHARRLIPALLPAPCCPAAGHRPFRVIRFTNAAAVAQCQARPLAARSRSRAAPARSAVRKQGSGFRPGGACSARGVSTGRGATAPGGWEAGESKGRGEWGSGGGGGSLAKVSLCVPREGHEGAAAPPLNTGGYSAARGALRWHGLAPVRRAAMAGRGRRRSGAPRRQAEGGAVRHKGAGAATGARRRGSRRRGSGAGGQVPGNRAPTSQHNGKRGAERGRPSISAAAWHSAGARGRRKGQVGTGPPASPRRPLYGVQGRRRRRGCGVNGGACGGVRRSKQGGSANACLLSRKAAGCSGAGRGPECGVGWVGARRRRPCATVAGRPEWAGAPGAQQLLRKPSRPGRSRPGAAPAAAARAGARGSSLRRA